MKEEAEESVNAELIINGRHRKVGYYLKKQLNNCTSFKFYVAFLTTRGLAYLKQDILNAVRGGADGKVLVSNYLNFTDPEALKQIRLIPNVTTKISVDRNMHSKGYFFAHENIAVNYIGSSNWTDTAFERNIELNVKIESKTESRFNREVITEFESQFESAGAISDEFLEKYSLVHEKSKLSELYTLTVAEEKPNYSEILVPNSMQIVALSKLQKLRAEGKTKSIVISATGTGKTYMAAFDVVASEAKRMLFVVHRENIARKALESFGNILGTSRSLGLFTGHTKDFESDFIFSTVQTISKESHFSKFSKDHFDYIIVDESHRSGAESYSKFLNYFTPKFLLGMTATPERTDGEDIFKLFGNNVAYEIRLRDAMKEDMLCSFHYYGITDLTVDGIDINDKSEFSQLVANERVDRIIEKAKLYSCYDGEVRGLVFCSRVREAKRLSELFNQQGYRTTALSGENSEVERELAIEHLESKDPNIKLDYIFTVDIFNEGVDIPTVNQIIMLRPTQSAIIFVQQLGRGLRKVEDSDKYLTVIDFIGNYDNNYLIPAALHGDRTLNKDRLRRLLMSGGESLPGFSTINFDAVVKERIYKSIDSAKTLYKRELVKDFNAMKMRLGRIPMMVDFLLHGAKDPFNFTKKEKSYYNFVASVDSSLTDNLPIILREILEEYSKNSLNGTSLSDPIILKMLLDSKEISIADIIIIIKEKTGVDIKKTRIKSIVRSLNTKFYREKYNGEMISLGDRHNVELFHYSPTSIIRTTFFEKIMQNKVFTKFLTDLTEAANIKSLEGFNPDNYHDGFILSNKYSRADVFRILGYENNPVAQNVGGYLIAKDESSCPIFVTYHKSDDISDSTKYDDHFINRETLHWFSKSNRRIKSNDVQFFINQAKDKPTPLFVKKNDDEGTSFYYLGDVTPSPDSFIEDVMIRSDGGRAPVVRMDLKLNNSVEESLYDYLVT